MSLVRYDSYHRLMNAATPEHDLKGAEVIVERLVAEGVPYAFGLCGHGILGLLDALYDRQDEIKTVSVHHEAVAGFMADAFYRVARHPVATFTSCGPGSANLIVAVATAAADSSALLAITGDVPTSQWNRGPFQETGRYREGDFVTTMRPYVKRSFQPARADMLPLALRQAFDLMRAGRPGPVHLDVPLNVFVERCPAELVQAESFSTTSSPPGASGEAVGRALELIESSEQPVIVAGHGVELAGAEEALLALAEALAVPVATSPAGKGCIEGTHRLSLGATGRNGTYPANAATRNADVVLGVGTRFDDRATSAWLEGFTYAIPPTRLIHLDLDPAEIGRNYPAEVGLVGDANVVLTQLRQALGSRAPRPRAAWWSRIDSWREAWESELAPRRQVDAVPIRPERLVADLSKVLPSEAIVLADVGAHHNWLVCEYLARPRSLLQSWGYAGMGFGVAGVLGAALAAPERPAVTVCGDGGLLMYPGVLATAVEYGIPAVWVVWNNEGYCSIRDQQLGYFGQGRELATSFSDPSGDLRSVDYAGLARTMGAGGERVDKPGDFGPLLEEAIASRRPYVLDVRVDREARPPATGSWDLPPLDPPLPNFGWPDM